MVLMVCSISFALDKKHSGEGELFLNEEIIEEYLNYLNTKTQHPLNFFISSELIFIKSNRIFNDSSKVI